MKMRMDGEKIMVECFLCEREAQMGPHVYNIRNVPGWEIHACDGCVKGNWDGVVPIMHPRLVKYLKSQNIQITLNSEGWIDWPQGFLRPGDIPWVRSKRR